MSAVAEKRLTQEEYLKLEEKSSERYEYIDGVLRRMASGTKEHNTLVQNFILKLALVARAKACGLYTESVKVKLPLGSKKHYYYPDAVLTCFTNDGDRRTVENPCLVVEVLSDSTANIDRVEKLEAYQRIVSIQQYVLVDQSRRKVEVYSRHKDKWIYEMLEGGEFEVACLETSMTIDEVYAGSSF